MRVTTGRAAAGASLRGQPGVPWFFAAATLARLASEMSAVAVVLLVLDRTGSARLAGVTVAASTLPSVLSGPLLGAWLDGTTRRREALAANQVLVVASMAAMLLAAGHGPGWTLPALALAAGSMAPMTTGGLTSMLPALVPAELLPRANAVEAVSFNTAAITGPALAGAIAATAGPGAAVAALAVLALAGLGLLLPVPRTAPTSAATGRSLGQSLRAGTRHLARTPVLRGVTVATAAGYGALGLLTVAFPYLAAGLGHGRSAAGFLWAAFDLGGIAGALGVARMRHRWPPERIVGAGLLAVGAVMLAWPLARSLPVALALVALAGTADGPAFAATFAVRQQWSPPELYGQIFTTAASLKVGAFALGAAAAGPAVLHLGARATVAAAGLAQFAAVAAGWLAAGGRRP
jgi:predicted MFS family arabinose efflux permease